MHWICLHQCLDMSRCPFWELSYTLCLYTEVGCRLWAISAKVHGQTLECLVGGWTVRAQDCSYLRSTPRVLLAWHVDENKYGNVPTTLHYCRKACDRLTWKNAFNCSMGPCFEFIAPSQSKLPLLLRNTSDQTAGFHAWRLLRHDQS